MGVFGVRRVAVLAALKAGALGARISRGLPSLGSSSTPIPILRFSARPINHGNPERVCAANNTALQAGVWWKLASYMALLYYTRADGCKHRLFQHLNHLRLCLRFPIAHICWGIETPHDPPVPDREARRLLKGDPPQSPITRAKVAASPRGIPMRPGQTSGPCKSSSDRTSLRNPRN